MTSAWLTFFSLLLAWSSLAATVSGHVQLADSAAAAVRKRQDYSGVVVWLEPAGDSGQSAVPLKIDHATMQQKGKMFVPHVLAIQAGAAVRFPNLDPIFHSAFSTFSGQVFDLGLYPPGTERTTAFRRTGVVRVFCNIHPTMSAVIVVLKYPWFAVTGETGAYSIPDVPAGEYQLRIFHERSTPATLEALTRKLEVNGADLAVPALSISETGYVAAPHKNKYGHDYSTPADELGGYPAGNR